MNFEEAKQAWQSQPVGSRVALRSQLESLAARMDRALLLERISLSVCGIISAAATFFIAWRLTAGPVPSGAVQGLIPLVLSVGILAYFVKKHRGRRHAAQWLALPLRDSLRHALDDTGFEIRRARLLGIFFSLMLLLLAIPASSLRASGKMDAKALSAFMLLCLVVFGANCGFILVRHFRVLAPRRRQLKEMLAMSEAEAPPEGESR